MYPNGSDSTAYKNQAMSSTSFAGNKSVHHYLGRPILGLCPFEITFPIPACSDV